MILLDTHIWIWWLNGSQELSVKVKKIIYKAKLINSIYISSISTWELAMLVESGRLLLKISLHDWILKSEKLPYLKFVPIDNRIAEQAVYLPGNFHKDPADRIIVATAKHFGWTLITKDEKILNYPHVVSKY